MRSIVYRNLDKPFQILSFNLFELTLFCFIFVGGGEIGYFLEINRFLVLLITIIFALVLFWIRRSLGNYFIQRFIRFLFLPSQLNAKLLILGKIS